MERGEMNEKWWKECTGKSIWEALDVFQLKLNDHYKIRTINTWAISLISYGAGIVSWKNNNFILFA